MYSIIYQGSRSKQLNYWNYGQTHSVVCTHALWFWFNVLDYTQVAACPMQATVQLKGSLYIVNHCILILVSSRTRLFFIILKNNVKNLLACKWSNSSTNNNQVVRS